MGRYRRIRARPFTRRSRARRSFRRRLRPAAASRQAAARVRNAPRSITPTCSSRRRAARSTRWRRCRAGTVFGSRPATRISRCSSRAKGFQGKVRDGVLTPGLRRGLSRALARADRARPGQLRPPRPLRAARVSAHPARAVHARVHQPPRGLVPDQRLRAVDPPHLHRQGAQQRLRHALVVRRHDRLLGRQQARLATRSTCCPPTSRAGRR